MLRRRHRSLDRTSTCQHVRNARTRDVMWRFVPRSHEIEALHLMQLPPTRPLQPLTTNEVTHPAPMTSLQIKEAIEKRPETNQDVKFLEKKKCAVCLSSWREILLEEKHLVFTRLKNYSLKNLNKII